MLNVGQIHSRSKTPRFLLSFLPAAALLAFGCLLPIAVLFVKAFGAGHKDEFTVVGFLVTPLHFAVLLNTLRIAGSVALLCLLLGVPLLYTIAHGHSRLRTFILLSLVGSLFLSTLVRSYALTLLLSSNGIVVSCLRLVGAISSEGGILFTRTSVILGMTYVLLPFFLFTAYASKKEDLLRLRNVALSQGASHFQYFAFIFLPQVTPGLVFGLLATFVLGTGFYITPELLGGGKGESMMLASLISQRLYEFGDWQGAAALSLLLLAVVCLLATFCSLVWIAIECFQRSSWKRGGCEI